MPIYRRAFELNGVPEEQLSDDISPMQSEEIPPQEDIQPIPSLMNVDLSNLGCHLRALQHTSYLYWRYLNTIWSGFEKREDRLLEKFYIWWMQTGKELLEQGLVYSQEIYLQSKSVADAWYAETGTIDTDIEEGLCRSFPVHDSQQQYTAIGEIVNNLTSMQPHLTSESVKQGIEGILFRYDTFKAIVEEFDEAVGAPLAAGKMFVAFHFIEKSKPADNDDEPLPL